MDCSCTTYACLDLFASPCDNTVDTGLQSPVTGTWEFWFEFNGGWNKLNVDVTQDLNIEIPNILCENYVHLCKFIDEDGAIFNNTCYKISVKQLKDVEI